MMPASGTRSRLPDRRATETFEVDHDNAVYTVSVGYSGIPGIDPDARAGEIFVSAGRAGTGLDITMRDAAIAASIALQYGCPPEVLSKAFLRNDDGTPAGIMAAVADSIASEEQGA